MTKLHESELAIRINACWLGKAIGGSLGGPHEGKPGPLELDFYDPIPAGILPNDDLDLQLVWLSHLIDNQISRVSPDVLAMAWRNHVRFPFDEYAVCLRNIAYELEGSGLGATDNWFSECMGAAIRSELWACLAPGDPERAAGLAWCDAVCDHAGDGVWAEIFLAALESAAFTETDRERLLDLALAFLPSTSRVKNAIVDTRKAWDDHGDWRTVRERIHKAYGEGNFTDVAANLGYTVLGWLAGEGDFGKSLCIAVNCGADTDCTGATLGSLLGILNPKGIPAKWRAPVGEKIVLSPQIDGITPPKTIDELTRSTLRLRDQLQGFNPCPGEVLPRRPMSMNNSPLRIPVQTAWSRDTDLFCSSRIVPDFGETQKGVLPGHWLRRDEGDFAEPVLLMRFQIHLPEATPLAISAWSQSKTAVWLDGRRLETAPQDPFTARCIAGAPSFHRGGIGNFHDKTASSAGVHELCIAWEKPSSKAACDLVIGCGDARNFQWLPFALTNGDVRSTTKVG